MLFGLQFAKADLSRLCGLPAFARHCLRPRTHSHKEREALGGPTKINQSSRVARKCAVFVQSSQIYSRPLIAHQQPGAGHLSSALHRALPPDRSRRPVPQHESQSDGTPGPMSSLHRTRATSTPPCTAIPPKMSCKLIWSHGPWGGWAETRSRTQGPTRQIQGHERSRPGWIILSPLAATAPDRHGLSISKARDPPPERDLRQDSAEDCA